MKRIVLVSASLLVMLIGGSAQAQQPRFTGYVIDVKDDFADVGDQVNHIPSSGTLTDIQDYTTETGEATHSCRNGSPNAGSHSVWFTLQFAGGTLSIDLQGSSYNTVMSIYSPAGTFGGLTSVACNDDDVAITDTSSRIAQSLPVGVYYVQISRYETAPTGSPLTLSIAISAALSGSAPASDTFATAQPIRFNETRTVNNVQYTTEEASEPSRACSSLPQPTHSVWFALTQPAGALTTTFSVTTEGSSLRYGQAITTDTVIEIFYGASLATLTSQACEDDLVGTYAALTEQGFPVGFNTVYLRVSTYASGNLTGPSSYKVKVTLNVFGTVDADQSFETIPTSLWKLSKGNNGDGQLCNAPGTALDGVCSFQFVGGPDEATSLKQTMAIPAEIIFKKGQSIALGFGLKATDPAINFKATLSVTYSDGTPPSTLVMKIKNSTAPDFQLVQQLMPLKSKHVGAMKIVFKNKSSSGTAYLDPVLILLIGSLAREAPAGILPLPSAPGTRG